MRKIRALAAAVIAILILGACTSPTGPDECRRDFVDVAVQGTSLGEHPVWICPAGVQPPSDG